MLTELEKEMREILSDVRSILLSCNSEEGEYDKLILRIDYATTDADLKEEKKD